MSCAAYGSPLGISVAFLVDVESTHTACDLCSDPAFPVLGLCPREILAYVHEKTPFCKLVAHYSEEWELFQVPCEIYSIVVWWNILKQFKLINKIFSNVDRIQIIMLSEKEKKAC